MKKYSSILVALLGIVIGLLISQLIVKIIDKPDTLDADYDDWKKLNLILKTAQKHYVDSVDYRVVTDKAALAALQALDPHSVYLVPEDLKMSEEDLSRNFEGIGIVFNVPNDTAMVMEVIPGGPSEKTGLMQGDRIIKVDEKVIAGTKCPQDSMVRRMRGPAGSKVIITVQRGKEIIPFEITRDRIPNHSVDASFMINEDTGYIRFSKFGASTTEEVKAAVSALQAKGMKRLLLDLRDNSGGYLDQALKLSNLFLEKNKLVVYLEGRNCPREDYYATTNGEFCNLGLVLLVNENTASSSEIFSGAMQDNGRAKIVGRRTFGKGLVQEPFYFNDGSGFRLTIARYYTPSGRCIQKPYGENYDYELLERYKSGEMFSADSMKIEKGGILPDVFVPMDTTKAGKFYTECNRKAVPMRFASHYLEAHRKELTSISDYSALMSYLDSRPLEQEFLSFAKSREKLSPDPAAWEGDKRYLMTQIRALVGRYSKLGENAYFHIYMDIDDCLQKALTVQ